MIIVLKTSSSLAPRIQIHDHQEGEQPVVDGGVQNGKGPFNSSPRGKLSGNMGHNARPDPWMRWPSLPHRH